MKNVLLPLTILMLLLTPVSFAADPVSGATSVATGATLSPAPTGVPTATALSGQPPQTPTIYYYFEYQQQRGVVPHLGDIAPTKVNLGKNEKGDDILVDVTNVQKITKDQYNKLNTAQALTEYKKEGNQIVKTVGEVKLALDSTGNNVAIISNKPYPALKAADFTVKEGKTLFNGKPIAITGDGFNVLDTKDQPTQYYRNTQSGMIVEDKKEGKTTGYTLYDTQGPIKLTPDTYTKLKGSGVEPVDFVSTVRALKTKELPLDRLTYDATKKTYTSGSTSLAVTDNGYVYKTGQSESAYDKTMQLTQFKRESTTWDYSNGGKNLKISGSNLKTTEFVKEGDRYVSTQTVNLRGKERHYAFDTRTGKVLIQNERGNYVECTDDCSGWSSNIGAALREQHAPNVRPPTVIQKLQNILQGYSEYSGLGFWTGLFTDDKEIAKKKEEITREFCDTILLGGTKCWTSKICQAKVDGSMGGTGVVTENAQGAPTPAAHIEADKSEAISFYNESAGKVVTQYLYRISYSLHNTNEYDMAYNIIFKGQDDTRAFDPEKILKKGASDRAVHSYAITKYSTKAYHTICLTFAPGIKRIDGGEAREICNGIKTYSGGPSSITLPPTVAQTQGAPQAQPRKPDFGDF